MRSPFPSPMGPSRFRAAGGHGPQREFEGHGNSQKALFLNKIMYHGYTKTFKNGIK